MNKAVEVEPEYTPVEPFIQRSHNDPEMITKKGAPKSLGSRTNEGGITSRPASPPKIYGQTHQEKPLSLRHSFCDDSQHYS